jgi:hypothetical protein
LLSTRPRLSSLPQPLTDRRCPPPHIRPMADSASHCIADGCHGAVLARRPPFGWHSRRCCRPLGFRRTRTGEEI